jgi:histidinol-phosphate aminotransferase
VVTGGPAAELPLRPELRQVVPYGAPQIEVPIRLNTNENPYAPSAALAADAAQAVAKVVGTLNRYPDRDATGLRAALAGYLTAESGVAFQMENMWAANGSNEVMLQLMQAFAGPGRRALTFTPSYSMYPEYARDTFTEWVEVPRADDFSLTPDLVATSIDKHRPDVVFLASPNNPTGTALALDVVGAAYDATGGMVVVDEAYGEFRRPGTRSATEMLAGRPRLVVTRTMSKAFAFAGARLGYLAADPGVVDAVLRVRLPYHLSAVTQAVARVALDHAPELQRHVQTLREERDRTVAWLRGRGLQVPDSDANFVMVGVFEDRHAAWQSLLEHGILVREVGPPGWLRVSIGTTEEMAGFRDAMDDLL